jgi:hypothetical protein
VDPAGLAPQTGPTPGRAWGDMVFGLDPQGLEALPHDETDDDDDDGHAAHASRAFLWEDWCRVAGSLPRVQCRGLRGRSWDQAS